MPTKRCSWGRAIVTAGMQTGHTCKNVAFIPLPKHIKSLEKCLTWIKLWGRPHELLNVSRISVYKYVCSSVRTKIFTYKGPYELNLFFFLL